MNRLLLLAGAVVLLVALIGGGALIAGGSPSSTAIPSQNAAASVGPASVAPAASAAVIFPGLDVDLRVVTPLDTIDVGAFADSFGGPDGTTAQVGNDGSTLWLQKDSEIVGIDPSSSTVRTRFPLPAYVEGGRSSIVTGPIAVSPGAIWTLGPRENPYTVTRWDLKTGKSIASVPVGGPIAPLFADGSIWVADENDGAVVRIDPATNKVVATFPVGSTNTTQNFGDIAAGGGSIWVSLSHVGEVVQIDPKTNKVVGTIHPGDPVGYMTVASGTIWNEGLAPDGLGDGGMGWAVSRLDATTGATSWSTLLGGGLTNLIVRPDAVWVGFDRDGWPAGAVVAIDPTSGKVVDGLSIADGQVSAVHEAFGSLWVVLGQKGIVERFSPDVLTVKH